MRFWIIYILVQIIFGLLEGVLVTVFFFFFNFLTSARHGGGHFYSVPLSPPPPRHKKVSYGPVSIGLWRASIGRFHVSYKSYHERRRKLSPQFFTFYASLMAYLVNIANQCLNSEYFIFFVFYIMMVFIKLILLCGDIEENPGPKTKPNDNCSLCHWNVISIPSHNFQKIVILESFVAMYIFDIICISETFLHKTYENNDLNLNGYSLLRSDLYLLQGNFSTLSDINTVFKWMTSLWSYNRIKEAFHRNCLQMS